MKLVGAKEDSIKTNSFELYGKARTSLLAAGGSRMAQAARGEEVKDYHTELGSVSG